jgi:hypothetical protein
MLTVFCPYLRSAAVSPGTPRARLFRTALISNNLVPAYVVQHVLGMPRSY